MSLVVESFDFLSIFYWCRGPTAIIAREEPRSITPPSWQTGMCRSPANCNRLLFVRAAHLFHLVINCSRFRKNRLDGQMWRLKRSNTDLENILGWGLLLLDFLQVLIMRIQWWEKLFPVPLLLFPTLESLSRSCVSDCLVSWLRCLDFGSRNESWRYTGKTQQHTSFSVQSLFLI